MAESTYARGKLPRTALTLRLLETMTAAEKALQKIQDQVTCGICLSAYKKPKLLTCFHVFCEQCLQAIPAGGQKESIACPNCRQETVLPDSGVEGLQGAFYIHYLFDIRDALQKVSSRDRLMCTTCKKREAIRFCRTCGFVCEFCEEHHQYWPHLSNHEIIDLDTLTGDVTTLVPPLKKVLFCSIHPSKTAKLYCEQCDELICRDCIVRVHRDHQYDLVSESFPKQEKVIVASLKPVEQQLATLLRAIEALDTQCVAVQQSKEVVVAKIHTASQAAINHMQQEMKSRETELVGQVEQITKQKLATLAKQKQEFQQKMAKLRDCHDFVDETQRTCSQGEILRMKNPLVKQIDELTGSFKEEALILSEQADLNFTHSLLELTTSCQQFGKVYCHPVCPEKCKVLAEGDMVTMRGKTVALTVEAFDKEGKAYLSPVQSLICELVTSDGRNRVRGSVKKRDQNCYEITCRTELLGKHQLHIMVGNCQILNSPVSVTVLPDFTTPASIIGDLNWPYGIAFMEGGEVVVAQWNSHCVTILSGSKRESFGTYGSAAGQFNHPACIAIDRKGNLLVVDYDNHRVQKLSPTGKFLSASPKTLQLNNPVGIVVHPQSHKVYVTERYNHRIQILNSDLTQSSSFGQHGACNGEFNQPYDISTDSDGNVYVVDSLNHRIQVFTPNGVYLRQFETRLRCGKGQPVSIAIDSNNVVYITETTYSCVLVFSTNGKFIMSFGSNEGGSTQFSRPYGIRVDRNGAVYVCDTCKNRVQMFT